MKLLKKVLIAFIAFCILWGGSAANASEYPQLTYWYSDSNKIGKWFSTPSVGTNKLNINGSFYFATGNNHARSQWSSAGISTSTTSIFNNADIQIYGGTYTELQNTGRFDSMSPTSTGVCYYDLTYWWQFYEYNGSLKSGYEYALFHIGIKDRGATIDEYKNTCTHELGHSLGWDGHASGSSNIMHAYASSVTTLTSVDKNHLNQIY